MTAPRGGPARSPGASAGARGAIVVGLAVIIGIIGLQILDDSGGGSGTANVTTTVPGASSPSAGGPTTTALPAHQPGEVRVKVYNASGVQGRAQTLTDTLHGKGYNTQSPDTLATQRQGTVIQCRSGFTQDGDLLAYLYVPAVTKVEAFPSDPPEGSDQADCLVVLGT